MVLELTPDKIQWLQQHGDVIEGHLSHGKNSCVWKVKGKMTTYALKTDHPRSSRWLPLNDEAMHLQDANRRGVGPRILLYNIVPEMLFLEYIPGKPLDEWIQTQPKIKEVEAVLRELLKQANALDEVGLQHRTLTKELRNILIDNNLRPHILDFDKTKYVQNPENKKNLIQYLLHGKTKTAIAIQKLLGITRIRQLTQKFL